MFRFHAFRLVFPAILVSGCVLPIFEERPDIAVPLRASHTGQTMGVLVSAENWENGRQQEVQPMELDHIRSETLEAYQKSGLFSSVASEIADTDLRAEVQVRKDIQMNMPLLLLTTATGWLIPFRYHGEWTVETRIKDRQGVSLGEYSKTWRATAWMQLFLLVTVPFQIRSDHQTQQLSLETLAEAFPP